MDKRDGDGIGGLIGTALHEFDASVDAHQLRLGYRYPLYYLDLEMSLSMAGKDHSTEDNMGTLPMVVVDEDGAGMHEWNETLILDCKGRMLGYCWRRAVQTGDSACFRSDASALPALLQHQSVAEIYMKYIQIERSM